jgi:hypothetical protein
MYILSRDFYCLLMKIFSRRIVMKSNRWILIAIIAVVIIWAVKGYAGVSSTTMTTYYPSSTGFYDQLNVRSKLILPCYTSAAAAAAVPGGMPNNAVWIQSNAC